jgi:diaminohydroxyphosphoribosylaminopyrimidine deaminase/5-amino-6-(5-phosphoribosylamino)uracil reductase
MSEDEVYMRRALTLAARARGRTAPNPMVGAVVVSEGRIVGEGFHPGAGAPHAEALALRQAGVAAREGTLYVTLEPCCHYGRTPPCTEAVLASGVRRVVVAMVDPFPKVAGGGLSRLREAGLRVECGILEREARELDRAYLKAVESGLPWVTLKMAMTLDGKIATRTGDSRWVTGEAARRHVHRLRGWNDAVMVGIGTAKADNPLLTARLPGTRNPLRVVVDARAELPLESTLAQTARQIPTLIGVGPDADTEALEALGVRIERAPVAEGRLALEPLLRRLVGRGVHSVLCEGGARLAGSLLDAGLVDEVAWFIAPKLAGGEEAPGPVAGRGAARMAEAVPLERVRSRRFGEDFGVFGYVARPKTPDREPETEREPCPLHDPL